MDAIDERQRWVERYRFGLRITEQGSVLSVGDGIAWLSGLPSAAMDELIDFSDGSRGLVFHLGREAVGTVLLQQGETLTAGAAAVASGERLTIGCGDALLGRVVDPLGAPLDGGAPPRCEVRRPLDAASPPLASRAFVATPLYTGTKAIDVLVPIGRGQRQLIIGDIGTGKTTLALDAVLAQRASGVLCVYVLVGQRRSEVTAVIETLRAADAMAYTTILVAEATALPGLKYLAPFAGCAIAEGWMLAGRDVLIVYDDLANHARTYRELSLLLRRPPGREAYPGDIFYLHSRLLERSTHLAPEHGGGSMTALPLVETEQGEIAAYIPTNLISITDGQVYLDRALFAGGALPAIDVTRSVSRIGGKAQHRRIKQESARIKLDYLQFLELEVFTRFGARLEASVQERIRRGRVLRELLKQEPLAPVAPALELAWLVAYNERLLDELPLDAVAERLTRLRRAVESENPSLDAARAEWVRAVTRWLEGGA